MRFGTRSRLMVCTLVLVLLGLLFVFEASVAEGFNMVGDPYFFLKQQTYKALVGGVLLVGAFITPTFFWKKTAPGWYLVGIVLLLLVFAPGIGREFNGAHRWLNLGGAVLQPIEMVKFFCIVFFASWMSKHQRLGPFLLVTIIPAFLVLMQPDLGSLLVVLAISLGMYFVSGGQLKLLAMLLFLGGVFVSLAVVTSPYRLRRLTTYLNPESDPLGASFHIRQITLALGNGGLIGQGLGNSRQKYSYIPEASSDSIFAIIAEEIGLMGSLVLLGIFCYHLHLGWRIALDQEQPFERLLAAGIVIWIASQLVLNISSVVALVPLTGVPLPFFSYGGSSLVMLLLATGVLLRLSNQNQSSSKEATTRSRIARK